MRIFGAFEKVKGTEVEIPRRATTGSAGYDFFLPEGVSVKLAPGESVTFKTGIRARVAGGWFLALYPKSGLGFKYHVQLANTVGIIDEDFYSSECGGEISCRLTNNGAYIVELQPGDKYMQGIFQQYGVITGEIQPTETRIGGFGSTGR